MKGDERKPNQSLTLLIEIILSIEVHEVEVVVIPISYNDELCLEDVVDFINQIYFTGKIKEIQNSKVFFIEIFFGI